MAIYVRININSLKLNKCFPQILEIDKACLEDIIKYSVKPKDISIEVQFIDAYNYNNCNDKNNNGNENNNNGNDKDNGNINESIFMQQSQEKEFKKPQKCKPKRLPRFETIDTNILESRSKENTNNVIQSLLDSFKDIIST